MHQLDLDLNIFQNHKYSLDNEDENNNLFTTTRRWAQVAKASDYLFTLPPT